MQLKDFVAFVAKTKTEQFEFKNPSDESRFLGKFRNKHPGEFDGDVWIMLRPAKKAPIEIKVTRDSTIVDRKTLVEICNVATSETNDMLRMNFGGNAILHEFIG